LLQRSAPGWPCACPSRQRFQSAHCFRSRLGQVDCRTEISSLGVLAYRPLPWLIPELYMANVVKLF
jgi:hypothetical protein